MEEEMIDWDMSPPVSNTRLYGETYSASSLKSWGVDFEQALTGTDINVGSFKDCSWGAWGTTDWRIKSSSSVKKRNSRDAELLEFKEVGSDPNDLEIGYNGAKIRTLDFDDAKEILKDGYIVEDKPLETSEEDDWLPSKSVSATDLDFLWLDTPNDQDFKDEEMLEWTPPRQVPCDRRMKVGKRRVALTQEKVQKNLDTNHLTPWDEMFENYTTN